MYKFKNLLKQILIFFKSDDGYPGLVSKYVAMLHVTNFCIRNAISKCECTLHLVLHLFCLMHFPFTSKCKQNSFPEAEGISVGNLIRWRAIVDLFFLRFYF